MTPPGYIEFIETNMRDEPHDVNNNNRNVRLDITSVILYDVHKTLLSIESKVSKMLKYIVFFESVIIFIKLLNEVLTTVKLMKS